MLQIHLSECHAKKFMLSGFKTKKKKTLLCDYITALGGVPTLLLTAAVTQPAPCISYDWESLPHHELQAYACPLP